MRPDLDHLYACGEFYDVLDACSEIETLIGRLRRQNLLSDEDAAEGRRKVDDIRVLIEVQMERASAESSGRQAS